MSNNDYMKQIGSLDSGEKNTLRIYGFNGTLSIVRLERKKDKSPDFAIYWGVQRVGSIWNKVSQGGKKYKTGSILNHLDLEKEIRFVIFPAKIKGEDHPVFLSQELDQSDSFAENDSPSSATPNTDSFD